MEQDRVKSDIPGERLAYEEQDDEALPQHEHNKYQALVARANYLAQDRSDTVDTWNKKSTCQHMPQRNFLFFNVPGDPHGIS